MISIKKSHILNAGEVFKTYVSGLIFNGLQIRKQCKYWHQQKITLLNGWELVIIKGNNEWIHKSLFPEWPVISALLYLSTQK